MTERKVLRLKEAADLGNGITFPKNQEIEIVNGVIYVNGNLLATNYQHYIYNWVARNPNLFENDTRNW